MRSNNQFLIKCKKFCQAAKPVLNKAVQKSVYGLKMMGVGCLWLAKFKKVLLALPVLTVALILAFVNLFTLPDLVGFMLQGDGSFAFQIVRGVAVLVPLLVTLFCLFLLFISKRTMTPWMVSVFSLLLPVLLYFTNVFPA